MKKLSILCILFITACSVPPEKKAEQLYSTHCGSCHMLPSPQDLPKHLWRDAVLPEMAARMGIKDSTYSPYLRHSFPEQEAMMKSGIYNVKPTISNAEWELLKDYVLSIAPESLTTVETSKLVKSNSPFVPKVINIDSSRGSSISFLKIDAKNQRINLADIDGNLTQYDALRNRVIYVDNYEIATTSYIKSDSAQYITLVGILNPSEIAAGKIYKKTGTILDEIESNLHRPVYTSITDLNNNGFDELLISEFGHLTGRLSLSFTSDGLSYQNKVLYGQPGVIRTIVKDMNADGQKDIVFMSSQGNEGVSILYQSKDMQFNSEQVIQFSPVYGSSWFELIDYNNDGFDDIITVNGDNADKTYVHKPYHGMRVFINDGNNGFDERFFYPLKGATRLVARDFDKDGDIDFGVLSSFPDYNETQNTSFVYLENTNAKNFKFESHGFDEISLGRWLLLDADDIDNDGDDDIVLSSFTYSFTPVPKKLLKQWSTSNVDLLLLENNLVPSVR